VDHPEFKTIITVEGDCVLLVDEAVNSLLNQLAPNAVLRVERGARKKNSERTSGKR
jgi:hypothetical protein